MNDDSRITTGDISSLLGVNAIRVGIAQIFLFAEQGGVGDDKIQKTHYELLLDDGRCLVEMETVEKPFNKHQSLDIDMRRLTGFLRGGPLYLANARFNYPSTSVKAYSKRDKRQMRAFMEGFGDLYSEVPCSLDEVAPQLRVPVSRN